MEVPEINDNDLAFPTRYKELLPKWEELTEAEKQNRTPQCEMMNDLFFKGGSLAKMMEERKLKLRQGVDLVKVARYVHATLGDFGPKHEHKIGGIGHMLAKWTE